MATASLPPPIRIGAADGSGEFFRARVIDFRRQPCGRPHVHTSNSNAATKIGNFPDLRSVGASANPVG